MKFAQYDYFDPLMSCFVSIDAYSNTHHDYGIDLTV